MATFRGFTVDEIKDKKFQTLEFEGDWLAKIGNPDASFKALFYGPSSSGKSVEVLKLADYLTNFGKVLYNSHEEGISKSLQSNIIKFGIKGIENRLKFYDRLNFDDMCQVAKNGRYKFIIIDSIQYMKFEKIFPHKALILISQINGKGKVRGGEEILHAVDVKVSIKNGYAQYGSRYAKKMEIDLFNRTAKPKNPTLFDGKEK